MQLQVGLSMPFTISCLGCVTPELYFTLPKIQSCRERHFICITSKSFRVSEFSNDLNFPFISYCVHLTKTSSYNEILAVHTVKILRCLKGN